MRDYTAEEREAARQNYGRSTGVLVLEMIHIIKEMDADQVARLVKTSPLDPDYLGQWADLQKLLSTEPARVFYTNIYNDVNSVMDREVWGHPFMQNKQRSLAQITVVVILFSSYMGRELTEQLLKPWREAGLPLPEKLYVPAMI